MAADADEDGGIEFIDCREVLNWLGDERRQDVALRRDRSVSIDVLQEKPGSPQPIRQVIKRCIGLASRGFVGRIQCEGARDLLAT
ncbi:MAG: hypothetical protein IPN24_00055 [Betaproteobacteria bacterium]|nr:hypothetical protein [Betaproteobacteria bacterium]